MSCWANQKRGICYECRTPILADESNQNTAVDLDVRYDGAKF